MTEDSTNKILNDDELMEQIKESEEDIKTGNFKTLEEIMKIEEFNKLQNKITVKAIFNSIERNGWLVGPTISRNIVNSKIWKKLSEDEQLILVKKVNKIKVNEKINPGIVGAEKCYYLTQLHNKEIH